MRRSAGAGGQVSSAKTVALALVSVAPGERGGHTSSGKRAHLYVRALCGHQNASNTHKGQAQLHERARARHRARRHHIKHLPVATLVAQDLAALRHRVHVADAAARRRGLHKRDALLRGVHACHLQASTAMSMTCICLMRLGAPVLANFASIVLMSVEDSMHVLEQTRRAAA